MASPHARRLRANLTEAESRLWTALRHKQIQGGRFRRQAPIGLYVVDFICFAAKLVVEVDGGQHAMQVKRDAGRDEWFASQGFRVLRFWNNEVFENLDGVVASIAAALRAHPHPDPPPCGLRHAHISRCGVRTDT